MKTKTIKLSLLLFLISSNVSFAKIEKPYYGNLDSSIHKDTVKSLLVKFIEETGIQAIPLEDSIIIKQVNAWQGTSFYPGIDDWVTCEIPEGTILLGGLPGQTEFYSVSVTLQNANSEKEKYWKSLQVSPHPQFGYRIRLGEFVLQNKSRVALSKTLANPQHGIGGAWQVFLPNYNAVLIMKSENQLK